MINVSEGEAEAFCRFWLLAQALGVLEKNFFDQAIANRISEALARADFSFRALKNFYCKNSRDLIIFDQRIKGRVNKVESVRKPLEIKKKANKLKLNA